MKMCCDHAPFQTATNVNRYLTITVHLHAVFTERHTRTSQYFTKLLPRRFQAVKHVSLNAMLALPV